MAFSTRLTPAMAARWRGAGLWSDETFATVLARRVQETPDREALTDGSRRLSYRELAHGIDRMAARLRTLGIGAGDVVTIQLPNWVEFALVFFALERLGAVAVTVNGAATRPTRVVFVPSADHVTNVTSYAVAIYRAVVDRRRTVLSGTP